MDSRAYYKLSDGKLIGVFNRTGRIYSFRMNKVGDEYQICYSDEDSHDLYSILEDTPVNAAFKMLYLLNDVKEYN